MANFQFQCPQGHLLEGDDSQAGQVCVCPTCGMQFLIPAPLAMSHGQYDASSYAAEAAYQPAQEPEPEREVLLHIACPNGHELETPRDMLGQDVLCPHCSEQFTLLEEESREYKEKRRKEIEKREQRTGDLWLKWAIGIAVVVGIGLVALIAMSAGR